MGRGLCRTLAVVAMVVVVVVDAVKGVLRGFDQLVNLVLDDAVESTLERTLKSVCRAATRTDPFQSVWRRGEQNDEATRASRVPRCYRVGSVPERRLRGNRKPFPAI